MRKLLFLLFIVVPLVELAIVIQVGTWLGLWWTLGLLLGASALGAWLLARESRHVWSEFHRALLEGRWPGDEVAHGALVLIGGTLLLTPGFLTDVIGFLLLFRPTRLGVVIAIRARLRSRYLPGTAGAPAGSGESTSGRAGRTSGGFGRRGEWTRVTTRQTRDGEVVEVEVIEVRREGPSGGAGAAGEGARGGRADAIDQRPPRGVGGAGSGPQDGAQGRDSAADGSGSDGDAGGTPGRRQLPPGRV